MVSSSPFALHRGEEIAIAHPRRIVPGHTHFVTRRTIERTFFLRPDPMVDRILAFCLALAAMLTGVRLHAFVAMSNHVHIVLTDERGLLPLFMHTFSMLSAKLLNRHRGRSGQFWEAGSYSAVRLVDPEDVLDKIAYLLANPVAAGLVAHGTAWPGLISHPQDWLEDHVDRTREIDRPRSYFAKETSVADQVGLRFEMPAGLRGPGRSVEAVVEEVLARRRMKEELARERLEREERTFLGADAVRAMSPYERSTSPEGPREVVPQVACRDRDRRIAVLRELKAFRRKYRERFEEFRAGLRDVLFPVGTWGPAMVYGALVEEGADPRLRVPG